MQQKSRDLESSDRNREELESKISTLQSDIDELAKDSEILNKELLGKPFSLPFRCDTCHPIELITYDSCATTDPLGYPLFDTKRLEDETFKLAGAVAQGLIQACRNTCNAIGIKKSTKCMVPKLLKRMQEAPRFILDKQGSFALGAARTALDLIHAHHLELDLEFCTTGAPEDCD